MVGGRVEVSVKPQGLAPGFHWVRTWVYPDGSAPAPGGAQLFLPLLSR